MLSALFSHPTVQSKTLWVDLLPGLRACRVSFFPKEKMEVELSFPGKESGMEVFFCFMGHLDVCLDGQRLCRVAANTLFLSLPLPQKTVVVLKEPVEGMLLEVKEEATRFWPFLGQEKKRKDLPEETRKANVQMGPGWIFQSLNWPAPFFDALSHLSPKEQGLCCLAKGIDVFYTLGEEVWPFSTLLSPCPAQQMAAVGVYLESHLEEKLTIANLSRRFCLSQTALKTAFRNYYGLPVHRYIQQKRMERAACVLKQGETNILEVAQSVGYESISQFNACFKQFYGMTPTQYRKMSDSGRS